MYDNRLSNLIIKIRSVAQFKIREQWPEQEEIVAVADLLDQACDENALPVSPCVVCNYSFRLRGAKMAFTKKEQRVFEQMFWDVCDSKCKTNKEKLERLADLLFELTGNVNLRMWLFGLKVK